MLSIIERPLPNNIHFDLLRRHTLRTTDNALLTHSLSYLLSRLDDLLMAIDHGSLFYVRALSIVSNILRSVISTFDSTLYLIRTNLEVAIS